MDAILLLSRVARLASHAAVDHAADRRQVADLDPRDLRTDGGDAADDLVPRQRRIERVAPIVADLVQVGMTDAAVKDVDRDIVRPQIAPLKMEGRQRRLGALRCITNSPKSSCTSLIIQY